MTWPKALLAVFGPVLIIWIVRYGWRSVVDTARLALAALKTRGEDDTPEDESRDLTADDITAIIRATREDDAIDRHAAARVRRRIAVYNPVAEESELLREIYAAQSLHRDGEDVFKGAPKEVSP